MIFFVNSFPAREVPAVYLARQSNKRVELKPCSSISSAVKKPHVKLVVDLQGRICTRSSSDSESPHSSA